MSCPDPLPSNVERAEAGMDRLEDGEDTMSKFMMIFRGGQPPSSPEQLQQHMQKWMTWFDGLTRDGVYAGQGAPLEPAGKVIRGQRKAISDGPFAEAKDLVGGYAVIEARDLEAAVRIASGCPTYEVEGTVEVRPVRAM
jgi:hypothetical protein